MINYNQNVIILTERFVDVMVELFSYNIISHGYIVIEYTKIGNLWCRNDVI